MPIVKDRTGETIIKDDIQDFAIGAKKSHRLMFRMMIVIIALIAGGIYVGVNRYAVVAWVEEYTGPLNLLEAPAAAIDPLVAEEQRREKIRQLYMANNFKGRERELTFIISLDSLKRESPSVFIGSLQLEESEAVVEVFGKSEKDVKTFVKDVQTLRGLRKLNTQALKVSSAIPGFRSKQMITATLRPLVPEGADSIYKQIYQPTGAVRSILKKQTEGTKLKIKSEGDSTITRDVALHKFHSEIRFEGPIGWFLNYLIQLHQMELNLEITKYSMTYAPPHKKQKPDEEVLEYNILMPLMMKDAKPDTPKK